MAFDVVEKEFAKFDKYTELMIFDGSMTPGDTLKKAGISKAVAEYIEGLGVASAAEMAFAQKCELVKIALKEQAIAFFTSPLGMATAVVAGIYLIIKAIDLFGESVDESREQLAELKNEYNSNAQEIQSLESELKTTGERLDELNGKENLSFTEQEELTRLQAQNAELQRTIDLLRLEQELKQKEINKEFVDTMHKHRGTISWDEPGIYDGALETNLYKYEHYNDELIKLESQYQSDLATAISDGDEAQAQKITKQYEKRRAEIESHISSAYKYLSEKNSEFMTDMKGVSYTPGAVAGSVEAEVNAALDYIGDFQDRLAIASGGSNAISNAFNRLITQQFSDATDGLKELGKEGKVTADTLNNPAYAEFVQKCIELGVVSDTSTNSLNFLASGFNNLNASAESSVGVVDGVANSYAKIAESVSGLKSELETINSAISEQGYTGSITPESYDALIAASSDYAQCIEYQNGALQVNTEKANALFEAKSKLQIAEIELQKLDEVSRWRENAAAIEELESHYDSLTDVQLSELDNLRKENAAIELNIQGYNVQIAAIEDLTSAYTKWKNASEANNSDSMYGDMASALEDIRAAMESGKTGIGNVVYQAAVELLVPDRQNVTDYMATLERYITEDASGLNNFVTDMLSEGLMTQVGDKVEMVAGTTIDQICEKMTITPEMARSMFNALEMYEGWDFNWTESDFGIEETGTALSGVQENLGVMSETLDGVSEKVLGTFGAEATLDILGDVQSVLQRIESFRFSTKYLNVVQSTTGTSSSSAGYTSSDKGVPSFLDKILKGEHADGTKHAEDGPALLGDEYSSDGSPRPEMVITDGAAYIAGLNGPEIVNLSEGDQVLTYDKTKRALSGNPKVRKGLMPAFATGAGGYAAGSLAEQMYLDGKIKAVSTPSSSTSYKPNLYTTNVVPNTGGIKTNNYTAPNYAKSQVGAVVSGGGTQSSVSKPSSSSGGGSGGSSSSGSSSSSSSSKQEKSQFEKDYEYHQHLLAMEQESYENYIDWLENAYKDAYEKGQIELEDFYRYEEEVFEGRKELFQDALEDIEHKIASLEREPGNESKIINYYNQLISMVDNQLAEARARGLNDDDEYVQELLEQKWDYADEIKDIQEEITENAMDAVDDLVEYRIDMLKQDIENEKDALSDKLGALKDFYDEQKQMLQDVYDEEKYLEEQAEKRKSVDDIRAEMDMLKFDDSAKAQKRMLELQEELLEAEKELSDFEKDHALETTTDLLDKMYEIQESQIQSEIDALDARLNDPDALYNQALRDIQNNTLALYEEMLEYNNKYGLITWPVRKVICVI